MSVRKFKVVQKCHSVNESAVWKKARASQCDVCAHLVSILYWMLSSFNVQTSASCLSTNLPSVFIASILPLKAIRWNGTAPHCLIVYLIKGTQEPVYWLQIILLSMSLPAHATLTAESRSLPCSPPCHQSLRVRQNFLSRYFLPVHPPFFLYDKYTFLPNIISASSSSIHRAA